VVSSYGTIQAPFRKPSFPRENGVYYLRDHSSELLVLVPLTSGFRTVILSHGFPVLDLFLAAPYLSNIIFENGIVKNNNNTSISDNGTI